MLGDNIIFTPTAEPRKIGQEYSRRQGGTWDVCVCVCGCETQLDGSQGPKDYLIQNHHAFIIWCEI